MRNAKEMKDQWHVRRTQKKISVDLLHFIVVVIGFFQRRLKKNKTKKSIWNRRIFCFRHFTLANFSASSKTRDGTRSCLPSFTEIEKKIVDDFEKKFRFTLSDPTEFQFEHSIFDFVMNLINTKRKKKREKHWTEKRNSHIFAASFTASSNFNSDNWEKKTTWKESFSFLFYF